MVEGGEDVEERESGTEKRERKTCWEQSVRTNRECKAMTEGGRDLRCESLISARSSINYTLCVCCTLQCNYTEGCLEREEVKIQTDQ